MTTDRIAELEARIERLENMLVATSTTGPMTEAWQPRPQDVEAMEREYNINGREEADQFRDYWIGEGKRKRDWNAAYRNWCRKTALFNARDNARAGSPRPSSKSSGTSHRNNDKGAAALDLLASLNPRANT